MVVVGNKYEFAFRHRTDPNYWKKPAFTLITFYIAILLLFSVQALVLVSFVTRLIVLLHLNPFATVVGKCNVVGK